jgi:hypothetical protein
LKIYQAIEQDNKKAAIALRNVIEGIARSLEARLERYSIIYDLSDRSSNHIATQVSYAKLLPALAKFAENYTSFRNGNRQGKTSFGELMDAALEISDAELKGTPDAIDKLRNKYDLSKLSKEIRHAHSTAVAAVDKHREDNDDYNSQRTRGHDTFLKGPQSR